MTETPQHTSWLWCVSVVTTQALAEAVAFAVDDTFATDFDTPPTASFYEQGDDWQLDLYFTEKPHAAKGKALFEACGLTASAWNPRPIEDQDWVSLSQQSLKPVIAGRFYLYGSHDTAPTNDSIPLMIDAGQAFGTGHHETTCACLTLLDRMADRLLPSALIDVGTGTGVLAMAAKRLWPDAATLATDIDPVAIEVTNRNMAANGFAPEKIITLVAPGLDDDRIAPHGPFDLLIANILANPLIELAPDFVDTIKPGGLLILSGLLTTQAEEVLNAYHMVGCTLTDRVDDGEWTALLLRC